MARNPGQDIEPEYPKRDRKRADAGKQPGAWPGPAPPAHAPHTAEQADPEGEQDDHLVAWPAPKGAEQQHESTPVNTHVSVSTRSEDTPCAGACL